MSTGPRTVIGLPAYNHESHLREALESLLLQTERDFAIVVSDDGSVDATPDIVAAYAARDPRLIYTRTPERLGYIGNARRCFTLARERFPEAEFFAWASDHDVWHPAWLARHAEALARNPGAVAATCRCYRMDGDGTIAKGVEDDLDTTGIAGTRKRFLRTFMGMTAGNMVYGLFRATALESAGIMRWYTIPDRLLLSELALYGSFVAVPEYLWYRRYRKIASIERQIAASFLGEPPRHVRYPWWAAHTAALWREYGRKENPHSPLTAGQGKRFALLYGAMGLYLVNYRWRARLERKYVRPVKRRIARAGAAIGRAARSLPGRPHRILRPFYARLLARKSHS